MENQEYKVLSISSEELTGRGFDVSKISDADMHHLAELLSNAIHANDYGYMLSEIAEAKGIPKL